MIYLRCDKCGATYDGEEWDKNGSRRWRGLHWSQEHALRDEARAKGWVGELTRDSDNDLCPDCAKKLDTRQKS